MTRPERVAIILGIAGVIACLPSPVYAIDKVVLLLASCALVVGAAFALFAPKGGDAR